MVPSPFLVLLFPLIMFGQNLPSSIVMVDIPGGIFTMGNDASPPMFDDQDPEHEVSVNGFKMSTTEISNEEYLIFLNDMISLNYLIIDCLRRKKHPSHLHMSQCCLILEEELIMYLNYYHLKGSLYITATF